MTQFDEADCDEAKMRRGRQTDFGSGETSEPLRINPSII